MTPRQPRIRAIFFDYGGTLDSRGLAWKEHFWPIYERYGVNVDYDRFVKAFYASDDSLVEEGRPDLDLHGIVHEQVRRVLMHLGIQDHDLAEKIAGDFCKSSLESINAAMPILEYLKNTFHLGIISNNYGNLEAICRQTGLDSVMDVMVDSRVIGATKPDSRIFKAGIEPLRLEPDQCMMVGDSLPRDVEGALKMGMQAVWLVPEEKRREAAEIRPSSEVHVITDLSEIPGLTGMEA